MNPETPRPRQQLKISTLLFIAVLSPLCIVLGNIFTMLPTPPWINAHENVLLIHWLYIVLAILAFGGASLAILLHGILSLQPSRSTKSITRIK